MRALRIAAIVLLVLIAVIGVGLWVVTGTSFGHERIRRFALNTLTSKVHGTVTLGRIDGNLLTGIVIHDLSITDSTGAPFLVVDEARTRYGIVSLAKKHIVLRDLTLTRPVVVLDRPPNGEWNYKRIFASSDSTPNDTTPSWGSWLAFRNVKIIDGRMVVRLPWHADTSLTAAQRDSAVAAALGGDSRNNVVRVAGGYQKVMTFDRINARMPNVRLSDPAEPVKLVQVASLQMIAQPFRPPVIDVRDVKGTFEFTGDSMWWKGAQAQLPGSRISGDGQYAYSSGDMRLKLKGAPVAVADLRWLFPRLPSDGGGTLDFAMNWAGKTQQYLATNADVRVGGARAKGTFGLTMGDSVSFHDTDLQVASLDTRLIEQMVPSLKLPRRGTLGGHLALTGGLHAMQVNANIAFDDARVGLSRMMAVGEIGAAPGGGVQAHNLRVRAEPVQVALLSSWMPSLPVAGTVSGTATLDGTTQTRLTVVADLQHVQDGAVSNISGRGAVRLAGGMWMDLDLRARPLSLALVGRYVPSLGLRGFAAGPVRLTGSMNDLRLVSQLRFQEGGEMDLRGRFDLASAQKGYDVTTALRLFNAHVVIARLPSTSITASASAAGRGFSPATMRMTARADIAASQYDSLAIDSASARVTIADGMLHAQKLELSGSRALISASGTFGLAAGREGELVVQGQADSLSRFARWFPRDTGVVAPRPARVAKALKQARADSLRVATQTEVERAVTGMPAPKIVVDTPSTIRADTIGGRVRLAGNIKGSLQRFNLRARLAGEDIAVAGNTAHAARADIAWTNARTPQSTIAIGAQLDAATVRGFELDSVDARVSYTPQRTGLVSLAVFQDHIHRYSLAGDYALHLDEKEVHLADVALQFDTSLWHGTQPATVRWGARGIEVKTLDLRDNGNGRIVADGLLPTKGEASLKFAVDNFALENIASLLQSDLELGGLVSVTGDVQGTLAAPRFRVGLAMRNGRYRGADLPDVHGRLQYANGSVTTRVVASRSGGSPLAILQGQLPINLAISLPAGEQRMTNGPITADLVADSLPIDLISRFTDAVSNVSGRAAGKIVVRGTLKSPKLAGALAVDRGDFRITSTGMHLQNVAGYIRMRDDTVFVDSIVGRSSGPVRLAGTVGLPSFTKPEFNLTLFTQNARVLDSDKGRLRADAELALTGPLTAAYISGRARVRSGVIYLPESDGKSVISSGDPALFNVVDTAVATNRELLPTQSPLLKNMRMDVALFVSRGTWVRSRDANVEIYTPDEGLSVHVDRAKQTLALDGVISSDNGQYTFLTKRFTITRGSAMFIGTTGGSGEPLNPTLQATGEYQVKQSQGEALNIRVLIGGTLRQPKLSLESDAQPPISQSDLLSYLAFGRSSGSLLQLGDAGGAAGGGTNTGSGLVSTGAAFAYKRLAGVAIGVLADEFEGDASKSLGADVFNITPADVPTEIYTPQGVSDLLRGTEVEVGKYVDPQTFLSVQARGRGLPGLRAQRRTAKGFRFELSLEPRYKIVQPQLESQPTPASLSVFGAFLTREWRF